MVGEKFLHPCRFYLELAKQRLLLLLQWLLLRIGLQLWHVACSALGQQAAKVDVAQTLHARLLQQGPQDIG